MRSLAAWCTSHVKHSLMLLRSKSHDREERARSLKDVVSRKVFRSGTQRYLRLKDLQSHLSYQSVLDNADDEDSLLNSPCSTSLRVLT